MAEHPIKGLMETAMENLNEMVDVNTIIGDPVETPDGNVIIPVSKVGFGFAAGGSEFTFTGFAQFTMREQHSFLFFLSIWWRERWRSFDHSCRFYCCG